MSFLSGYTEVIPSTVSSARTNFDSLAKACSPKKSENKLSPIFATYSWMDVHQALHYLDRLILVRSIKWLFLKIRYRHFCLALLDKRGKKKCKEKLLVKDKTSRLKFMPLTIEISNNGNTIWIPWIAFHYYDKTALQSQEIKSKQEKIAQNEAILKLDQLTLTGKMLIKTKLLSACIDQQFTIQQIISLWCPKCALLGYQQFLWSSERPVHIRTAQDV